jgi:hypothetical protein
MTEEAEKRMQERMEALAAQVESLRSELRAVREQAANRDAVDFGGGGEPDWSGAMGKVPDGFIENPAIPPIPDTTAAKDPNALQHKSIDDRKDSPPPGVTQIHDFDEAPLSNTRRIQIVTEAGTGTNPTKLKLVDPDGNADFQTKWMIPLREATTGGREIKWACIGGEVGLPEGGEGCAPEVTLTPLPGTTAHPNGGVRITVTPCEGTTTSQDVWNGDDGAPGADGADGCTPTVTAGTTPSDPGPLAFTITPCGEGATPISVYHGKNGEDGCSPTVSPAAQTADGRTSAGTVTDCDGHTITIYNGKDGDWDGKTDTAVADESAANTQYRSIEERSGDNALQMRRFDESPLSGLSLRITTEELQPGPDDPDRPAGRYIRVVAPDGRVGLGTKWMLPIRRADADGSRDLLWVSLDAEARVDGENEPDHPACGNPLNDENDYNPLDHGSESGHGWRPWDGGRNPLDDPGAGGYTPTCRDNIVNTAS